MGPRRKKSSNAVQSLELEDQMDEECDFKRELKVIQNEFRKTKSFKVSKLGPHYEELEKTMLSSAHSSTRNNIIIYGLPGFGRKSAVRYAIRSIHSSEQLRIIPIWIDASLFQTEIEFVLELVRQVNANCSTANSLNKSDIFDNSLSFKNLESSLESEVGSWVLVVDKIENLAQQKRQSVLYALLDWLQNNKNKVSMVGITSDLKFAEKLEKRVKSRFTADYIHMMTYELDGCLEVIVEKLKMIREKHNSPALVGHLITALQSSEILQYLEDNIINLMKSLDFVLNLFQTTFCLMNSTEIENKLKDNTLDVYLLQALKEADKLHSPISQLKHLDNLTQPELQALICVRRMILHEKNQITLGTVLQELAAHRRITHEMKFVGTPLFFTPRVIQKAIENLISLRILSLEDEQATFDESQNIVLALNMQELTSFLVDSSDRLADSLKELAEI